ncbi:60S ribosomal protein L35, L29 [Malassezia sp. CBS 17886]|nr:60S ribosomal protein L35, L29 [Malassezia sp. CBS 17886]
MHAPSLRSVFASPPSPFKGRPASPIPSRQPSALIDGAVWLNGDEAAETSDSESNGSDGDASPGSSPHLASSSSPPHDAVLPRRPTAAMIRDPLHRIHRCQATVRRQPRALHVPSHPTPINNRDLFLPPGPRWTSDAPQPRSADRIRAAQHLFRALGHPSRGSAQDTNDTLMHLCGKAPSQTRAHSSRRISLLHGLTAHAKRRRNHGDVHKEERGGDCAPSSGPPGAVQLSATLQGTQNCVFATERNTIELVVTPPSPRPDEADQGVFGVRLRSHRMREPVAPEPVSPTLQPPAFDLAPGRARHIARRTPPPRTHAHDSVHTRAAATVTAPTGGPHAGPVLLPEPRATPLAYTDVNVVVMAKVRTSDLQNKSKADLQNQLEELRKELLQLRVQKVAGGGSSKLARINTVRKNIARVLTVMNQKQRANLREFYKGKKYQPLDLRPKKTRAIRRRMTKFESEQVTVREHKKTVHFGLRRYVLKA